MSNLDRIKSKYKPYRYTYNGNALTIESSSGKYVLKKKQKDLFTLFGYLESKGFSNYPRLIETRGDEYLYEYVEDTYLSREEKVMELERTLASLHNKTVYFKRSSKDSYKEIKENIENNILYFSSYFDGLFRKCLTKEYMDPCEYLFARNFYIIDGALKFCTRELDLWYELISTEDKSRVSVVHGSASLEHFVGDKLISWDNYRVDTPIIDFVNLYKKEYASAEFSDILESYLRHFELLEPERKLLFILINMPEYFELNDISTVKKHLDYLHKTEKLTRPYYSEQKEEQA